MSPAAASTLVPSMPASTVIDRGVMRGADLKARLDMIIDLADHAMKDKVDYGTVPGTDKPSLWQAGADKLCVAFQVAPKVRLIEPINTESDERAYRVIVVGVHQGTGVELGEGAGECSSNEEKYRWRYSVHENEWKNTPDDLRRLKFKRDGSTTQQIRTNPADVANTVLKMAVKRAKIAMVLAVTGAAAIFTQDVEDLADELREQLAEDGGNGKPETRQPQRRSAAANGTTGAASPKGVKLPDNCLSVLGYIKKVWPGEGNKPTAIVLTGNDRKYTTFKEDIAKEAKAFEGTDHQVRLGYTETVKGSATYYNAVGIILVEEPKPAAPATPAAAAQQPQMDMNAGDIFGGAGRQPGEEG